MRSWLIPVLGTALCLSCATKPAEPLYSPGTELSFDRLEARDPGHVSLYFLLRADNPGDAGAELELQSWRASVNGIEGALVSIGDRSAGNPGSSLEMEKLSLVPGASVSVPVRLDLNLDEWSGIRLPDSDEYSARLDLDLAFRSNAGKRVKAAASAEAVFPRIKAPEFNITSIVILKAELINTRFKVRLRIDNPNLFPVDLASFTYELYSSGRLWADGEEQETLHIPAKGSADTDLFLLMNFINMRRDLLDQVIALRQVRYRFKGEAVVDTHIEYLPSFLMAYDCSGLSNVIE
jgi:LEA14-like dessication related protein